MTLDTKQPPLKRQERDQNSSNLERSSLSASSLQYQRPRELWIDTVDPHVRQSISTAEWKRQEAIFELIFTEDNFVRTMEYVNEASHCTINMLCCSFHFLNSFFVPLL